MNIMMTISTVRVRAEYGDDSSKDNDTDYDMAPYDSTRYHAVQDDLNQPLSNDLMQAVASAKPRRATK